MTDEAFKNWVKQHFGRPRNAEEEAADAEFDRAADEGLDAQDRDWDSTMSTPSPTVDSPNLIRYLRGPTGEAIPFKLPLAAGDAERFRPSKQELPMTWFGLSVALHFEQIASVWYVRRSGARVVLLLSCYSAEGRLLGALEVNMERAPLPIQDANKIILIDVALISRE